MDEDPQQTDPWRIELIVVRHSHDGGGRSALSRDVERGLLVRVRRGVYVERAAFERMTPSDQHIVRMRALVEVSDRPAVFSHVSAAVAHGLPVLRPRLDRVHLTVDARSNRSREGVTGHLLPLQDGEVQRIGPLLVTTAGRTVVDLAGAAPFDEGVMAADALLLRGVPREVLLAAIERAGPRRAAKRIGDVARFASPGGESAAESRSRTSLLRLGIEPPILQHRMVLADGAVVFADMLFPAARVAGEVDGAMKLLDPAISRDARLALLKEKRREDAMRLALNGLARWGWLESGSTQRLGDVLQRVGVHPRSPRATLADYAAVARTAKPRLLVVHG